MIKIFTTNSNGKIELTARELEDLLANSYREGYDTAEKAYSTKKFPDMNNKRNFVYTNDPKVFKEDTTPKLNVPSVPTHNFNEVEKELASLFDITPNELNRAFSNLFGKDSSNIEKPTNDAFGNLKKEVRGV